MRVSKNRKSVHLEIGFWFSDDGSIHVASNEVDGFHVAVNSSPTRRNGHPTLYRRLAACLGEAGAPGPPNLKRTETKPNARVAVEPLPSVSPAEQEIFGTAVRVGPKWYFRYEGGGGVLVPLEGDAKLLSGLVDGQAYSIDGTLVQSHRPGIGSVALRAAKPIG